MAKERILCQGDWFLNFDAKYVGETELRKADRTVGVNCNIFSNISSGTA